MDNEGKHSVFFTKYPWIFILLGFFLFTFILFFLLNPSSCNDKTPQGKCSKNPPFFCDKGKLIENPSVCGCPESLFFNGSSCISKYYSNSKRISLEYNVDGVRDSIDFIAYEGFYDYVSKIPRFIPVEGNKVPTREDFKLRSIDNEEQKVMLMPLVIEIKNRFKNRNQQAKAAISIVQNIEYDNGKTNSTIWKKAMSLKYPYEVIYNEKGSCGEKSLLLAFLLKELDYGVAIFYFPNKNHEAVGIKCPFYMDFKDTGYCFIETTSPLENGEKYLGTATNFISKPEVIVISEGKSIGLFF